MIRLALAAIFLAVSLPASAATAFLSGQFQQGTVRTCVYTFAGNNYYMTVQSYQLCPLQMNV